MELHSSAVRKSISDLLAELDLPKEVSLVRDDVLRLEEKKNHYSLVFVDKLLFRIIRNQTKCQLQFRQEYEPFFPQVKPSSNKWLEIELDDIDGISNLKNNIRMIFKYELNKIHGDAFGCCSKYVECSDSKRCVHEDFLVSLCCQYRINLLEDRIFYGKNRNC